MSFRHEQADRFPATRCAFRRAPKRCARGVLAGVGIEASLHNDACEGTKLWLAYVWNMSADLLDEDHLQREQATAPGLARNEWWRFQENIDSDWYLRWERCLRYAPHMRNIGQQVVRDTAYGVPRGICFAHVPSGYGYRGDEPTVHQTPRSRP